MSSIITNARTIHADEWALERDGLWYVRIPFDCTGDDDEVVVIQFVDSNDYIQEHKADFDALNPGSTIKGYCVITADAKPTCDMLVQIDKAEDLDGEVIYKKVGGQFVPEWKSNETGFGGFGALAGMMGGMGGMNFDPSQIIDAAGKVVNTEEPKEESKEEKKEIII